MANRSSSEDPRLIDEPVPRPRTIVLCGRVYGDESGDVSYVVVRAALSMLLRFRQLLGLASAIDTQVRNFHRMEVWDWGVIEIGSAITDDAPAIDDPIDELVALMEESVWVTLPDGWQWPEGKQLRSDSEILAVGTDELVWRFHQKHGEIEYETEGLTESMINDLITELTT